MGIAGVAFAQVAVVIAGWVIGYRAIDFWGAFLIPTILIVSAFPIIHRFASRTDSSLENLYLLSFAAFVPFTYLKYLSNNYVYGQSDSTGYLAAGKAIASNFWDRDASLASLVPKGIGTRFTEGLTGIVQLITGRSDLGSFMVFSMFAFVGIVCLVEAARLGLGDRINVRGYAMLVLFLPSMLFWSAGVGKDAWMLLGVGFMALGAAKVLSGRQRIDSVFWLGLGVVTTAAIRPHITLLMLGSFVLALVLRSRKVRNTTELFGMLLLVLVIVGLTVFASSRAVELIPTLKDGVSGAQVQLDKTATKTLTGGSQVDSLRSNSPAQYPTALFTVLFRPTLLEASSPQAALSALESTVLLVFLFLRRRNIMEGLRRLRALPYLLMALCFCALFAVVWSNVGNLGIIVRQRTMILPFLLLFPMLRLPAYFRREEVSEGEPETAVKVPAPRS